MKVLLFARARDLAGTETIDVPLPAGATVRDLRQALAATYPRLAPLAARSAFAVANELVGDDTPLAAESAVALLPPVSGG